MKDYTQMFENPKRETVLDGLNTNVIVAAENAKRYETREVKKEFGKPKIYEVKKIINHDFVNLREKPTISSKMLSVLKRDAEIQVEVEDLMPPTCGWYSVRTPNGIKGYVMSNFIG